MNLKSVLNYFYLISLTFLLNACSKELNQNSTIDEISAKNAIREIVGSKGEITFLTNELSQKTSILSLSQLQEIAKELSVPKTYQANEAVLIIDTSLSKSYKSQLKKVKSMWLMEDDEGPKPAGYYHVQFNANSPLNQNLGGLYTLHLYFNTDSDGRVIGSPSISYTGVGLASWQQVNISSISFNGGNYTSSFNISGINTYGVQFGSFTLGWSAMSNFLITINMDEFASKQVTIIEQR